MKRRFTLLFLMSMLVGLSSRAAFELEKDAEGFYLINTAEDLVAFSNHVNNDGSAATYDWGRLTADIDMAGVTDFWPIGLYADLSGTKIYFHGRFDGQGHVIKNLSMTRPDNYEVGLFSRADGAIIENLGIVNATMISTSEYTRDDGVVGVRAGIIAGEFGSGSIMRNCWTAGELKVETLHPQAGYICGEASGNAEIYNCFTTGEVITCGTSYKATNCYAGEDVAAMGATGELCFALNGDQSKIVWYQTLGEDALPCQDKTHKQVFGNGPKNCDGTPAGAVTYSNTDDGSELPPHEYDAEGYCQNCGFEGYEVTPTVDGWYEVTRPEEMRWVSRYVNKGHTNIQIRLMNDLDMIEIPNFPPIGWYSDSAVEGKTNTAFNGIFDGQYHVISNLRVSVDDTQEAGFFSRISGGSGVRNLGIIDAIVENQAGRRAGILGGEIHNTRVENCFTAGNLTVETTHGQCNGFAGEAASTTLVNCWSTYEGGFVGTSSTTITNCNYYGMNENIVDDAQSGALCFKLNGNSFDPAAVTYYQTLGTDYYPTWDKTHGLVCPVGEGEFMSAVTEEEYAQLVSALVNNEHATYDEYLAPYSLIETYLSRIDNYATKPFAEYVTGYNSLQGMRDALDKAKTAYEGYKKVIDDIQAYVDENKDFFDGAERDQLISYLSEEVAPGETFPNGSSAYILSNRSLGSNYVTAEISYAQELLNNAILHGYAPGADITNLLVNANFADGTNGWTTKGAFSLSDAAAAPTTKKVLRGDNNAFDISQTVEGLKNGLYEFRFGGYSEINNGLVSGAYNYRNIIYANENGNYQKPLFSDLLTAEEVEGQPGFEVKYDDFGEELGYKPNNTNGVGIGVDLGHWDNRVIVEVTDGTLTVGVEGHQAYKLANYDWIANARLRYLGEMGDEHATEAMDNLLADIQSMGSHIAEDYMPDMYDFSEAPNFDRNLLSELNADLASIASAETAQQKYDILCKFADLFRRIDQSKLLYSEMMEVSNDLLDVYGRMGATDEEMAALQGNFIDPVIDTFNDGSGTDEEVQALIDRMQADDFYRLLIGLEPELVDDVYQIENPYNLIWFSHTVNGGNRGIKGALVNDIDMSVIKDFTPIGLYNDGDANVRNSFTGTFDGQGHIIKNLAVERWDGAEAGLFSRTYQATVQNLGIVNATIISHTASEARRAGVLAGEAHVSNLINCFTAGELTVETEHSQCCGLAGEAASGNVRNCYSTFEGTTVNGGSQVNVFGGFEAQEMAATGELCYRINDGLDEPIYFQNLGEDAYPVLDKTHKQVYVSGALNCDGSLTEEASYSNVEGTATRAEHQYEDGICSVCGYDMGTITEIEDGYYIIRTPYNLRWFSKYVNQGNGAAKARLEADIDMKDINDFRPISRYSDDGAGADGINVTYSGTFDGNYHVISNLHMEYNLRIEGGLFGRMVTNGVVKNLGMVNVNIKNTHSNGCRIGCIVGENNGGRVENVYVMGDIVLETTHLQKSAICGEASGGSIVNCYSWWDPLKTLGTESNCYTGKQVTAMAATGELCYKLNNGVVNDPIWRQTIGTDEYPTFNTESAIVYANADGYTNEIPEMAKMEGTKDNPFIVKTAQDMVDLHLYLNPDTMNYVVMENDIDMSGIEEWTPYNVKAEDYPYWIDFNGQGHVISNFAPKNDVNYQSIFGILCGAVRFLGIENASVKCTKSGTGILAAWAGRSASFDQTTVIENVYVTGTLECQSYTGGMIGNIGGETKMLNCYANVDINSTSSVTGGLVGRIQSALDMENAYAAGSLNRGGGIIGGGLTASTPAASYKNVAVWNNDYENFGETSVKDKLSGLSFYNGTNFAELQKTVVAWDDKVWSCDMEEGSYPVLVYDPTGLRPAFAERVFKGNAVFTLSGVKVADDGAQLKRLPKGIYIVGGQKVLVK